jgi:hypothetical protein
MKPIIRPRHPPNSQARPVGHDGRFPDRHQCGVDAAWDQVEFRDGDLRLAARSAVREQAFEAEYGGMMRQLRTILKGGEAEPVRAPGIQSITHQSIIKTTFLLYSALDAATMVA